MLTKCPTCQSRRVVVLDVIKKQETVTLISGCKFCGLVFVNPPPTPEETAAYYRPGGAWEKKLRDRLVRIKAPSPTDHRTVTLYTEADRLYAMGKRRVLDFGCGAGVNLDSLKQRGWQTTGIDPAQQTNRHRMLDQIPDKPEFDFVIMKHVLEHLIDPLSTLRQARQCLTNDGRIYVGTPTLDGLREHGQKTYCINPRQHITAYTRRSLRNLLGMAGFVIEMEMPTVKQQRMAFMAVTSKPTRQWWPLRDARWELSHYQ